MQRTRKIISELSSSECKQYIDKIAGRELSDTEFNRMAGLFSRFSTAFFCENDEELYQFSIISKERFAEAEKMFDEFGGVPIETV